MVAEKTRNFKYGDKSYPNVCSKSGNDSYLAKCSYHLNLAFKKSKKALAYWNEFLVNGSMPSGITEENALKHVLKRAMEESSCEVEDGIEVEDGNYHIQLDY